MTEQASDLVSMADIARLAGQSRSTVGNWKARDPDFPPEHSRGPRGPLYQRESVVAWLSEKGRLAEPLSARGGVFRLLDMARRDLPEDMARTFITQMAALRLAIGAEEWERLKALDHRSQSDFIDHAVTEHGIAWDWEVIEDDRLRIRTYDRLMDGFGELRDLGLQMDLLDLRQWNLEIGGRLKPGSTTPISLALLMANLAGPATSLYDPACGGGSLLMVATVLSKAAAQDGPVAVYGQDIDPTAGALAATWLVGDGVTSRVEVGDVFSADRYPDLQVDRIVTHPPFGPLRSEVPLDPDDPRWIYGEPAAGDAGAAWIQHCLFHLAEGGRAVIALPPRVLADRSKAGRVMQGIVKAGYLEAVIALPPRILPDTPVAPVLMVFAKGRERLDGKPAPTLMVDAEDVPTSGGRRERTLPIETIERLEAVVKAWTEGTPPESSDAAVATYDQIVENGFDLTPRRYVVQPGIEINTSALRKEALMLRGRLSSDIERSHLADASLLTLLEGGIR